MSLYDDILDTTKEKPDQIAGWSSGIKLLQSQLQLKKAAMTQPRREQVRKQAAVLAPVIDLKSRKEDDDSNSSSSSSSYIFPQATKEVTTKLTTTFVGGDPDWLWEGEYDPLWPNDYEKVIKDLKDVKEKEKEKEEEERKRKFKEERDKRTRERYDEDRRKNGFGSSKNSDEEDEEEAEEEEEERPKRPAAGAAIAPPASLQDSNSPESSKPTLYGADSSSPGLSVAAKIMAKYGFKEGQGLGKQEQGIATALQVEKTSKRGGRIISEKDIMPPPPVPAVGTPKQEPSITEMMKNPSKVVLLRNMVGPGEVDEELEPEVKDECNTKYGEVIRVVIFELPDTVPEESVRIFVEFKRIESAIKAVVDLNGRFFGGRQVRAGFYEVERFQNLDLVD